MRVECLGYIKRQTAKFDPQTLDPEPANADSKAHETLNPARVQASLDTKNPQHRFINVAMVFIIGKQEIVILVILYNGNTSNTSSY